jgi:hypothetical protein
MGGNEMKSILNITDTKEKYNLNKQEQKAIKQLQNIAKT